MNKRKIKQWKLLLIVGVLLILLTATSVLAQESPENPVAALKADSSSLSWTPHVKYQGLLLTVSGPNGFYWQKNFEVGENPAFNENLVGSSLQDGQYNYELLVLPAVKENFREEDLVFIETNLSEAQVQFGAFTILGGEFIAEARSETASSDWDPGDNNTIMDQVILDDLIVDGSLCTGFDCVNGESFGFDTIRLKENNLRIHFQDTSTSASFPTNDWRIAINDSANGGASYFAIQDVDAGRTVFQIEAGAGSNALYIDDYGRVGLGTSTPAVELEIRDSDTPSVRLNQDGSGGWSPQTWDMAGNEANFFIRDVTNGSQLPFRIQPGADSNALTIKSDNKVGIGTWSPLAKLHVVSENNTGAGTDDVTTPAPLVVFDDENGGFELLATSAGTWGSWFTLKEVTSGNLQDTWGVLRETSGSGSDLVFTYGTSKNPWSNTRVMTMNTNGDVGIGMEPNDSSHRLWVDGTVRANNVTLTSDVNAKENFSAVNSREVLALLAEVPISSWNFKSDETQTLHMGPMAQDFSKAFGLGNSDTTISIVDESGVALAAIQGLNEIVMEKNSQIADLEARLDALEANNAPNQFSIVTLVPWLLLTITLVVLAFSFGKRQVQKIQK